jgi:DNA-binding PadR family transcriptional regulator
MPDPAGDTPLTPLSHAILLALAEEDLHGYALAQAVERETHGAVRPGTGTLYAALQRLSQEGLIADSAHRPGPDEDQRRKYYRITELGRSAARAEAMRLRRVLSLSLERGLVPEELG